VHDWLSDRDGHVAHEIVFRPEAIPRMGEMPMISLNGIGSLIVMEAFDAHDK
jgi:hypothetical protein